MEDDRPVKSLLYGELTEGTRPVGRPKLRYKDTCKSALKCGNALGHWKAKVENRTEWRHMIRQTCNKVNEKRVNAYERQRDKGEGMITRNSKLFIMLYAYNFTVSALICVVTAFGTRRIIIVKLAPNIQIVIIFHLESPSNLYCCPHMAIVFCIDFGGWGESTIKVLLKIHQYLCNHTTYECVICFSTKSKSPSSK